MGKEIRNFVLDNVSTGLNVVDSPHDIQSSDLQIANNVIFRPTGEAESIEGLLQTGNDIYVNSSISTSILGGVKFNSTIYLMASNGTEARLVYLDSTLSGSITAFADAGGGLVTVTSANHGLNNGDCVTISGTTNYNGEFTISNVTTNTFDITDTWVSNDATGTWSSTGWTEVSSVNFDPSAKCDFVVYNSNLWFVNGLTTNSNVLHFVNTSNVLSGLTTASGLESGINRIELHLERVWISKGNNIFVSIQYPTAANSDWDASRVYSGSSAPGLIQLDNNTEDSIKKLLSHFGQLVVFREFTINVITGKTILTSTIEKSFNSRGIISDFSVSRSDRAIYFLSRDGVKQFSGITTQDQTTEFDSISSIGIDRKIRTEIEAFSDQTDAPGYAFKDKYYLSDSGSNNIYVFDEITGGWSKWDVGGAEIFIENGDNLFCAKGAKYYQINADSTSSITSHVKTKDFNMDTDQYYKLFEKLIMTFKTFTGSNSITMEWYIDGGTTPSGTSSITILGSGVKWDSGSKWDSSEKWDSGTINFRREKYRKLKSGVTIAFGVKATGTNRFSLSAIDLLYELLKKEA
jgi:hypothetical protein